MSDPRTILPGNATPLMHALEGSLRGEVLAIERPIGTLYDADLCPPVALSHLAWAFSVDVWSDAWSDAVKREVIGKSLAIHRIKGSVGAVRRALASIGIDATLTEWFQTGGPVHTFDVDFDVDTAIATGLGTIPRMVGEIERVVDAVKPLRSHYAVRAVDRRKTNIHIRTGTRARAHHLIACMPIPRAHPVSTDINARSGARARQVDRSTHDVLRRTA